VSEEAAASVWSGDAPTWPQAVATLYGGVAALMIGGVQPLVFGAASPPPSRSAWQRARAPARG
jgi:hypothetical protein